LLDILYKSRRLNYITNKSFNNRLYIASSNTSCQCYKNIYVVLCMYTTFENYYTLYELRKHRSFQIFIQKIFIDINITFIIHILQKLKFRSLDIYYS
jgi:hypothetical protein